MLLFVLSVPIVLWALLQKRLLYRFLCIVLFYKSVAHPFTQINTKHSFIIPINIKILFRNY